MICMPKVTWKQFLKGKVKLKLNTERTMRHAIRERAKQNMEDLIFILENIKNVSPNVQKDFAKIFHDDKQYFKLLKVLDVAWRQSYSGTVKLATEEAWNKLYNAAMEAGLGVYSSKRKYDRNHRLNLMKRLEQRQKETGIPYLENIGKEIACRKTRKHFIEREHLNRSS